MSKNQTAVAIYGIFFAYMYEPLVFRSPAPHFALFHFLVKLPVKGYDKNIV